MTKSNEDIARHIISSNRYLTLSTCLNNIPWIAPVAYAVDENCNFYFYSAIESLHMQHIKENPRVAGAIFNSTESSDEVDGLQFSADVTEVAERDLQAVMDFYFKQSFPKYEDRIRWVRPIDDFFGNSVQRFYRMTPLEIFKPDPTSIKVDRRIKLNIEKLKEIPFYA